MPPTDITLGPVQVHSGEFVLPRSKSLANRALIIQALAPDAVRLSQVGDAEDVTTMRRLLAQVRDGATLDCGPAGTTFRFLTAYLSTQEGTQTLTGSERMLQRPVGALVQALRQLGVRIEHLGEEGYPPLSIGHRSPSHSASVTLAGDVSSQYLSALMLIGPALDHGLRIEWTGELVSRPYLEMTASLMRHFGAEVDLDDPYIRVHEQPYTGGEYEIEADWSAASYAAAWCAVGELGTEFNCVGLRQNSLQGDHVLTAWIAQWGVETSFHESGLRFRKTEDISPSTFECDFSSSPDLAQTFSVLCACTGTTGLFSGLQTLRIKETDRIEALKTELAKVQVYLSKLPPRFSPNSEREYYMQEGLATWTDKVEVNTYDDHRMAMALSLLASRGCVSVKNASVVGKSFPQFWESLRTVGAS